jgi:nucleotide-binding universal stress UspA family protein
VEAYDFLCVVEERRLSADAETNRRLRSVRALAADPAARVRVVAPALNSRVRHWFSDCDPSVAAAEHRLRTCIAQLEDLGLDVEGHVGDEDPMQAIADALVAFPATELVIATHPSRGRTGSRMTSSTARSPASACPPSTPPSTWPLRGRWSRHEPRGDLHRQVWPSSKHSPLRRDGSPN